MNEEVFEQILFCKPLKTTSKSQDVFGLIKENFLKHGLNMNVIGSWCSYAQKSVCIYRKKEIPEIYVTHCLLHQYTLAAKTLHQNLQNVLSACVKTVYSIRTFPEPLIISSIL